MTTSVTWTSPFTQWGVYAGGGWIDLDQDVESIAGDMVVQTNDNAVGGLIVDVSLQQTLQFVSIGGVNHPIEPPIFGTSTMTFWAQGGGASPWTVEVLLMTDPIPANFASGSGPLQRDTVSLGTFDLGALPGPSSDPEQRTLTFSDDANTLIRGVMGRGFWSGRLAFGLRRVAPGTSNLRLLNRPSLLFTFPTTQEVFFTGLVGGPPTGRARAMRDGRYAMGAFSGELVEDGEIGGLYVRPFDRDPDDPEDEYRPSPLEGTVDDPIPDVT